MAAWVARGYGAAVIAAGVVVRFDGGVAMVPLWAAVIGDSGLSRDEATRLLRRARYDDELQRTLAGLDGLDPVLLAPTLRAVLDNG